MHQVFLKQLQNQGSLGRAGGEQDSRFYLQQFRLSVTVTSGGSLAAPPWASVSLGEVRGFPYTEFMAPKDKTACDLPGSFDNFPGFTMVI